MNTGDARTEILRSIRAHLAQSAPEPQIKTDLYESVSKTAVVSVVEEFKRNVELVLLVLGRHRQSCISTTRITTLLLLTVCGCVALIVRRINHECHRALQATIPWRISRLVY